MFIHRIPRNASELSIFKPAQWTLRWISISAFKRRFNFSNISRWRKNDQVKIYFRCDRHLTAFGSGNLHANWLPLDTRGDSIDQSQGKPNVWPDPFVVFFSFRLFRPSTLVTNQTPTFRSAAVGGRALRLVSIETSGGLFCADGRRVEAQKMRMPMKVNRRPGQFDSGQKRESDESQEEAKEFTWPPMKISSAADWNWPIDPRHSIGTKLSINKNQFFFSPLKLI